MGGRDFIFDRYSQTGLPRAAVPTSPPTAVDPGVSLSTQSTPMCLLVTEIMYTSALLQEWGVISYQVTLEESNCEQVNQ